MYKLFFIFILFSTFGYSQNPDAIIGKYHLPNKLDLEIFKTGNSYSGKILALNGYEDGQTKDIKNPNEDLKDNNLVGKVIITELKYDKDKKQWNEGKMYGPEKGIIFNLKITKVREGEIEVVGSKFLFWRTLIWKKI